MSNDNDTNDYSDWLDKYYDRFDYSDFTVLEKIDTGSTARIKIATLKDIKDTKFVLKCFNYVNYDKITLEKVVNEIRLLREVNYHPNIIRLYGITKDPILGNCSLVLEYADGGTLQNYLQNHIKELKWDDRFDLAFQIASAISCLHNHDIIHCDLHSANILVHQNKIKLADFGQSKKIVEASSSSTSSVYGVVPYVDPKFDGGKREEIIEGTPTFYSDLYEWCWKYEPDERPDIQKVVSILKKEMGKLFTNSITTYL
ncbi:uncharacterized protein OCT59_002064 [Rhizophagus irregularis]|uniref:uncharacterized protein n=1 Tax=Rhizophagus irregularis TaxID=588596 RepID=UPI001C152A12|nr:hypothetical protein OCT59_002064 [Rhizophagus irregularis]CAB5111834.1 unnamed protein product [Rhizophagus irregularis]